MKFRAFGPVVGEVYDVVASYGDGTPRHFTGRYDGYQQWDGYVFMHVFSDGHNFSYVPEPMLRSFVKIH